MSDRDKAMMQERKASYIAAAWKAAGFSAAELAAQLAAYRRFSRPQQPEQQAAEQVLSNVLALASALRDQGIGRGHRWTMTTSDQVWDLAVRKLQAEELVKA